MHSITPLVHRLIADFPLFTFREDSDFRWSPKDKIIFYDLQSNDTASLLHEVSHAVLGHSNYTRDIELLAMESSAWVYAQTKLAEIYEVSIDETKIENSLDSYRDWLHERSICPHCTATGLQTRKRWYLCVACGTTWRTNEARTCALRRHILDQPKTHPL